MSLSSSKSSLESELKAMYDDTGSEKSSSIFAKKTSVACFNFATSAKPKTLITFAGPATGTGIGGLDSVAPGMGLMAAMPLLIQDLTAMYTIGGANPSSAVQAQKKAEAIYKYFSQAMVMTLDTGGLDPITFSGGSAGIGGVLAPVPGMGYSAAKEILEATLMGIWSNVGAPIPAPMQAQLEGMAYHTFFIQGIVTTVGVIAGMAGASVSSTIS